MANTASITWHTQHDDRVCPICKAIDGYVWTFEGLVPNSLTHPVYGEVWNTSIGSLAHSHGTKSNCRCHIIPQFDLKDLADKIRELREKIEAKCDGMETEISEVDDTKGVFRCCSPVCTASASTYPNMA
jgi:uncharacterized protein with gpF-like domain